MKLIYCCHQKLNMPASRQWFQMMGKCGLFVLVQPGEQNNFRSKENGGDVTYLHPYLPSKSLFAQGTHAVIETQLFKLWAQCFVVQTKELVAKNAIYWRYTDFGAHFSFFYLSVLFQNNIIFVALPSHTFHLAQVLDGSLFLTFRKGRRRRGIFVFTAHKQKERITVSIFVRSYPTFTWSHSHTGILFVGLNIVECENWKVELCILQ